MFQYDRPLILSHAPETGPIYDYLFKFVEYCNVMLNNIAPDQLASAHDIIDSFIDATSSTADITINAGNMGGTVTARKELGLVFLNIGKMTAVPSGDSTITVLTPGYRPAMDESVDYVSPTGQALRVTVASNGKVTVHSYASSTQATIDARIRMVYPAANI